MTERNNPLEVSIESVADEEALDRLLDLSEEMYTQMNNGDPPSVDVPKRTQSNIKYDEESGVWVLGDKTISRSATTLRGAKKILKLSYTIEFLAEQLNQGRSSTLRELYYLSESWDNDKAQFSDQDESNDLIEDLEVLLGIGREDLHMRPEESGATLIGPLEIIEQTNRGERNIHCQKDIGEGGYQIPNNPDTIEFVDHDIDFALAVETGGMRDRLVENGFDEDYNCLIIHLKGQPSRATRRIVNRVNTELDVPVAVFTDGDPWSYRIFASVSFSSIRSAHLSSRLATPEAEYIGIRPTDITEYDLPTDPLSDSDINALESVIDDPRFQDEFWQEQIQHQLDIGVKSEQQSLAAYGLDFVTQTYLPERLEEEGFI